MYQAGGIYLAPSGSLGLSTMGMPTSASPIPFASPYTDQSAYYANAWSTQGLTAPSPIPTSPMLMTNLYQGAPLTYTTASAGLSGYGVGLASLGMQDLMGVGVGLLPTTASAATVQGMQDFFTPRSQSPPPGVRRASAYTGSGGESLIATAPAQRTAPPAAGRAPSVGSSVGRQTQQQQQQQQQSASQIARAAGKGQQRSSTPTQTYVPRVSSGVPTYGVQYGGGNGFPSEGHDVIIPEYPTQEQHNMGDIQTQTQFYEDVHQGANEVIIVDESSGEVQIRQLRAQSADDAEVAYPAHLRYAKAAEFDNEFKHDPHQNLNFESEYIELSNTDAAPQRRKGSTTSLTRQSTTSTQTGGGQRSLTPSRRPISSPSPIRSRSIGPPIASPKPKLRESSTEKVRVHRTNPMAFGSTASRWGVLYPKIEGHDARTTNRQRAQVKRAEGLRSPRDHSASAETPDRTGTRRRMSEGQ